MPTTPGAPNYVQAGEDKGKIARTKIKKLMKELVMGEQSGDGGDSFTLSECLQVLHHRSLRNHLLLVYPREVLILDLDLGQTVGVVGMERGAPNILSVFSCSQRDAIFLLTEGGSVSVRLRRKGYSFVSTPAVEHSKSAGRHYSFGGGGGGGGSVSVTPAVTPAGSANFLTPPEEGYATDEKALEVVYEQKGLSENVRLVKNGRILGMAVNSMLESTLCVLTTEGRLIFLDVIADCKASQGDKFLCLEDMVPSQVGNAAGLALPTFRMYTSGILTGLASPPFIIRMCPPLTMKNLNEHTPYLALGAANGNIQVANVSTGKIEREFAVHTFPVCGIEWTSLNGVLSHAHQNLSGGSGGGLVRNELVHTDIRTGKVQPLRTNRSEEPPIEMLRVSHLKQYFIVAFSGAPFELWDLRNMTILRTMPKKFPPITALDWSPLHNLKSLKKKQQIDEKEQKSGKALPLTHGTVVSC